MKAAENLGMTTEQMNEFNSYYDVMNFSEHVTCPVISCFSLQDTTDPTRTNLAPFNLLDKVKAEDKVYIINPFLGHATPADWGNKYMEFFKKYYSKDDHVTGINKVEPVAAVRTCDIYSIDGKLMKAGAAGLDSFPRGIYIVNGKKLAVK